MPLLLPLRKSALFTLLSIASCGLAFAGATLTPQGGEYAIAGLLKGDQVKPQVAISSQGGYLVWEDNSVSPDGSRIQAVRLDTSLHPAGEPFILSSAKKSKTAGNQQNPQVALLPDGGAVIVFEGGFRGIQQVFARFVAADGTLSKSDIRISKYSKSNQANPVVATSADGTVMIVWSAFGVDGSRQGVFAQCFSVSGSKIGSEFQVNQFTLDNQRNPSVTALGGNKFAVAWVSESQRSPQASVDIFARLFDSAGTPLSNEFLVNDGTNICANPSIAGAGNGFAVAWSQNANQNLATVSDLAAARPKSTNSWDTYSRIFDANGLAFGSSFRLNTYTYGDQYAPKISAAGDSYLAVWTSLGQDGSWEGVYGQFISNTAEFLGDEFRVNTTTVSRQIQPTVASDGVNNFLSVWASISVGTTFDVDLYAQKYSQSSGQ